MNSIAGIGYTASTQAIMSEYPLSEYPSPNAAFAGSIAYDAVYTDALFTCPALRADQWLSQYVPVYRYEFADETAPSYQPPAAYPLGAYHTSELQYLFLGYHGATGTEHSLNPEQQQLSDTMISYWTTFAKSGDPNSSATLQWPLYTTGQDELLNLPDPETQQVSALSAEHNCGFWDANLSSPQ